MRWGAVRSRDGDDIVYGRVGQSRSEHSGNDQNSSQSAQELCDQVKGCVPGSDFAEQKGQRDRWVQMRTRLLAPRRVDDGGRRRAHREAHEQPPLDRILNRLMHRELGYSSAVQNKHAEIMNRPSSAASIKYSGQW